MASTPLHFLTIWLGFSLQRACQFIKTPFFSRLSGRNALGRAISDWLKNNHGAGGGANGPKWRKC
ncbi:MAG: hypothetical protein PHV54_12080 [Tolumonas sp.]|nr:hypothetical protein [Tolumonas sp.]